MNLDRRTFLRTVGVGGIAAFLADRVAADEMGDTEALLAEMVADPEQYPGVALAILRDGRVTWSRGFGLASIEKQIPMTADTIQNIGSISKTVTATAIMQLVEAGRCELDVPIDQYLPFEVRVPRHPEAAITIRQLLAHTSGIGDGRSYDESYACGDPSISLEDWIRGYLLPVGTWYHARRNFHTRAPGERYAYSNVGFGLLGLLVQYIADQSFNDYCKEKIFAPLGMDRTGWMISDINPDDHATLYISENDANRADAQRLLGEKNSGKLVPLCLYSFPNYPDGLVRTSVNDLGRFIEANLEAALGRDSAILKASTVEQMLSKQVDVGDDATQGLCWSGQHTSAGTLWSHDGGDPGVVTFTGFNPSTNTGVIMFANGPVDDRLSDLLKPLVRNVASVQG